MIKPLMRRAWIPALVLACLAAACFVWQNRNRPKIADLQARALTAANRGDSRSAIGLYDQILRREPTNSLALLYRGQLARDAGQREAARDFWRRVPDTPANESGIAFFLQGTMLLEDHQAREAELAFLESKRRHPTYNQPRARLVDLYIPQLRGADIRRELEGIRELRAWSLQELLIYTSAMDLDSLYKADTTIPRLTNYVAADPQDLESRLALAFYLDKDEQYASAERLLREWASTFDRDPRIAGLLAESLLHQGRLDAAQQILDEWRDNEAGDLLSRARGLLALARDDWPEAARSLRRAVQREPENLSLAYKYGLALARGGENADSQRQMAFARLLDRLLWETYRVWGGDRNETSKLVPIATRIGELLTQMDRRLEAVAWLEQVVDWEPGDGEARRRLAVAIARLEDPAGGRDGVLALGPVSQIAEPEFDRSVATAESQSRFSAARPAGELPAPAAAVESGIRLSDRHAAAGIDFQYDNGETPFKYLVESSGGGVAVLDFDNDGWPDLYFPQGGRHSPETPGADSDDRLYRNRGDETFADVTLAAGLGDRQYSQGCSAADFDNDGDTDLLVTNWGTNVLYVNNGDGTFTDVTRAAGLDDQVHWSSSAAFADLDRDGALDLYVVNYVLEPLTVCRHEGRPMTCSPRNFAGEDDQLYSSRGDGTFADVSAVAGILAPEGKGLGIVVVDLDDDEWPDIYISNDGTPNFLFRNLGGSKPGGGLMFEEVGLASGAAVSGDGLAQAGMGIAVADFRGKNLLDVVVTNFYLEGACYYLNHGSMQFSDATRAVGLLAPTRLKLGFGMQAADFDLDGHFDLFIANGHVTDARSAGEPWKMPAQLMRNLGGGTFADVSAGSGEFFKGERLGRGVARADWNRDGKPDMIVVHQDCSVGLLRNETLQTGNRLKLELRGVASNRDAIGARIVFECGGRMGRMDVVGGDGYFATNDRLQILSMGKATTVDRLEVVWPNGSRQVWRNIPAGASWLLIEGRDAPITR